MGDFLHTFAEELASLAQIIEDHSKRLATDVERGSAAPAEQLNELAGLRDMLAALSRRVAALKEGQEAEWEVSKESLHGDLEALDREIHAWIRKTT